LPIRCGGLLQASLGLPAKSGVNEQVSGEQVCAFQLGQLMSARFARFYALITDRVGWSGLNLPAGFRAVAPGHFPSCELVPFAPGSPNTACTGRAYGAAKPAFPGCSFSPFRWLVLGRAGNASR
jgi:hypothetical protein